MRAKRLLGPYRKPPVKKTPEKNSETHSMATEGMPFAAPRQ
ncbi:MAG: hypothetical protein ACFNM7_09820 [Prevotella conceptionensis]|nr:hypothetical protein HMPREF0670_02184 [Prevotella sp. oral taxon 317 str. F0108]